MQSFGNPTTGNSKLGSPSNPTTGGSKNTSHSLTTCSLDCFLRKKEQRKRRDSLSTFSSSLPNLFAVHPNIKAVIIRLNGKWLSSIFDGYPTDLNPTVRPNRCTGRFEPALHFRPFRKHGRVVFLVWTGGSNSTVNGPLLLICRTGQ